MEKRFRQPRVWSNRELSRFSQLWSGDVVNVSGWTDEDKEGNFYRSYFSGCRSYTVTNYHADRKGLQGTPGELFLDLESPLPSNLHRQYDVVFNHTTLEHVFDVFRAFSNLAEMTRDVLVLVVPYLQQVHGTGYLDYWRFTPHAMKRLYEENGLSLRYLSANGSDRASVYLFCIGYRSDVWDSKIPFRFDLKIDEELPLYGDDYSNVIGANVFED